MAQESVAKRGASAIEYAPKRKWGYDAGQVNAFLEHAHHLYEGEGNQLTQSDIQNVSFDLKKGGYIIEQVDAALSRLERAVIDKQTQWELSHLGQDAFRTQNEDLFSAIARRAERDHGARFADGMRSQPSYDRKQVDSLIDQITSRCSAQLGHDDGRLGALKEFETDDLADVTSSTVSNVIFTQRKGARGYDERQVDYFLSACVNLLSRLESYARLADYTPANNVVETAVQPESNVQGITPLFSGVTAASIPTDQSAGLDLPQSFAPAVTANSVQHGNIDHSAPFTVSQPADEDNAVARESYDVLQRAERHVFGGADASQTSIRPPSSLSQQPIPVDPTPSHTTSGFEDAPSFGSGSFGNEDGSDGSGSGIPSLAALAHSTEQPRQQEVADVPPQPTAYPDSGYRRDAAREIGEAATMNISNPLQAPGTTRSATHEPVGSVDQAPANPASNPTGASIFPTSGLHGSHDLPAAIPGSTAPATGESSPGSTAAFDDFPLPPRHAETEQVFDNMPDLSFPIFRPKFQQDTDTAGSADDGDDASRESGVAGNAEHDDHAGSGGE